MILKKLCHNFTYYLWPMIIFFALVSSIELTSAQVPTNNVSLTPEEQTWISEHPVIKVSNNINYSLPSPRLTGLFSIAYLNLIASKIGVDIEYITDGNWSKLIEMVKNKETDLIHTISKSKDRSEHLIFTEPYLNMPVAIFGRNGDQKIDSIDGLEGKKIGLIKGHIITEKYQRKYPHLSYVVFDKGMDALRALSSEMIDVYIAGQIVIENIISQNSILELETLGKDLVMDNGGIDQRFGVHKDNQILLDIINKGMAAVTEEEFNQISEQWFGILNDDTTNELTPEEQKWLSENKIIRVVRENVASPGKSKFEERTFGVLSDIYLSEIAKLLKVEFVAAENNTWEEGLELIRIGEADIMPDLTPSKEREAYITFSEAYFSPATVIYTRNDIGNITELKNLNNKKLAQIEGYLTADYIIQDYPDIEIIKYTNVLSALRAVLNGEADAFVGDVSATNNIISSEGIVNIHVSGTTGYSFPSHFGTRSDLPHLASAINKSLKKITPEQRQNYLTEWLTRPVITKIDYGPLWITIGVGGMISLIILVWNRQLMSARVEAVTARKEAVEAHKKAVEASEAKSDFLASMSHDLRTPLNAIIGFSETLKEGVFGPLNNNKQLEYIGDIHSSGKYLLKIVNDILDLSTLEAGEKELDYENIDVTQLISELKNIITKLYEDKNIKLTLDIQENILPVYADGKALMQILVNLVSNSIKFSSPGGNITVKIYVSDNNHIIQVIDNGRGISEEDIKVITQPFKRADVSHLLSHEEGTGLGLSIVDKLVNLHDGKLDIMSELDKGTTITVALPLETRPAELQLPLSH